MYMSAKIISHMKNQSVRKGDKCICHNESRTYQLNVSHCRCDSKEALVVTDVHEISCVVLPKVPVIHAPLDEAVIINHLTQGVSLIVGIQGAS